MSEHDAAVSTGAEPIAIIGMACRFPGGASNTAAFWRLLADGVDAIRPIERDGLDPARYYDPTPRTPGRMMTRWGGFLNDLELFDADFFGISPREAASLDPAQRLLLEATWEACEDATIDAASLAGQPVGVFVGQWLSDFESRLFADPEQVDLYATTGSGRYATSGRISYVLGATGPSLTLDTACSSSLVAVHLACQSLRSGESSLAVAAGVNVILQPHITIGYSQSGMMAPDGHCKFGDANGDGYVRSEGAGVVLLKPLARALADGDPIRAVIRGSAVNNDGRGSGHLATPSRTGQAAMLRAAYANAGVAPAHVGYVEAHGTGTRAGDPVELGALGDVLAADRASDARCLVGSVKTNIGHTEGAAGLAGLIKGVLALEHETVPPSLHLREPNPSIPWAELPFDLPQRSVAWPRGARARIAGVSAFGITGTNAHVVLEEAPVRAAAPDAPAMPAEPLALSASSPAALRALAASYADRLDADPALALRDACATAARHRAALHHRAVFVAADRGAMVERLRRFADGDATAAAASGRAASAPRRIAFVFPGQGGQWVGMGRELLAAEPAFAAAIERCDAALPDECDWTVREQLALDAGAAGWRLDEIGVLQPVLLAVEIALAELWRSWGVVPEAVVGHSMGEAGAAYFAGALSLDDAMRVICARSVLLQRTSGAGAMAMVELPMDEAARRVAPYGERLCVAVSNGPRSSVVSGEPAAVAELLAALEREGVFCRAVKVDVASHSPQMDPLVPALVAALGAISPRPSATTLYSTVDAAVRPGEAWDAAYWGRNLRRTVRFAETTARMLAAGIDAVVEVSPHPALLASVAQTENAAAPLALPSLRRGEPERATVLGSFGGLWAAGHPVDWTRVFPDGSYARVALPLYPWQRERHWSAAALPAAAGGAARRGPVLGEEQRGWLYVPRWEPVALADAGAPARWLVVGGDGGEARAIAAALVARGDDAAVAASVGDAGGRGTGAPRDGRETGIVFVVEAAADAAWRAVADFNALRAGWPAGLAVPRVWWVTRGAQRVGRETPSPDAAEQGALWGAARVVATEHPDWWGGLADLDADAPIAAQAETLAGALRASRTAAEDQVAVRGGAVHALRLTRAEPSLGAAAYRWREDAAYLITGGFGGVARRVALEMVRQGARRLVLLGRSALPPRSAWAALSADDETGRRVAHVRALEHAGASVHVLHADVSDEAQVRAALGGYAADGWPEIRGVIHTAAALGTRLTSDLDEASFARVTAPKLGGAVVLDRVLPTLDVFVAFSSMMAFWAPAGEANYAAANAGLDALAQARLARGQHALSIQWGPWSNVGLWEGAAAERNMEALARDGVRAFAPEAGVAFLAPLLASAEPVVAVLPIDWSAFRAARRGRDLPLYRGLVADAATSPLPDDGLAARLREAGPSARRALLDGAVRAALGAVLRRPAAQIDAAHPFGAMGLDSLMALELRNRLETALERSLSATLAWNYPTVEQLAAYLATFFVDDAPAAPAAPAAVVAPDDAFDFASLLGGVADLSDDDAARALRGGR